MCGMGGESRVGFFFCCCFFGGWECRGMGGAGGLKRVGLGKVF